MIVINPNRTLVIILLNIGHINLITSFRLILPLQCCVTHFIRFLSEWVICHLWNLWRLFTNLEFFSLLSRPVLKTLAAPITSAAASFPQQFAPFPGGHGPQQLPQDQNKEIPPNSLPDARLGGTPFTLHVPYAFFFFFWPFLFIIIIFSKDLWKIFGSLNPTALFYLVH